MTPDQLITTTLKALTTFDGAELHWEVPKYSEPVFRCFVTVLSNGHQIEVAHNSAAKNHYIKVIADGGGCLAKAVGNEGQTSGEAAQIRDLFDQASAEVLATTCTQICEALNYTPEEPADEAAQYLAAVEAGRPKKAKGERPVAADTDAPRPKSGGDK